MDDSSLKADIKQIVETYRANGVVVLPRLVAEADIHMLVRCVDHVREHAAEILPADHVRREDNGEIRCMRYLDRVIPEVDDFARRPELLRLASELTGHEIEFSSAETFDKPAGVGSAARPHQDGIYAKGDTRFFHFWVPLDPADETNGAMRYWLGAHDAPLLPHDPIPGREPLVEVTEETLAGYPDPVTMAANPGDVIAHADRCVHDSPPNLSAKPRCALAIAYKYTASTERKIERAAGGVASTPSEAGLRST